MEKEIDFLKLYNKLDSKGYRLFTNPQSYLSLFGIGASTIIQMTHNNDLYNYLLTLPIIAASAYNIHYSIHQNNKVNKLEYILKKIKKTSDYQECLKLYNDYILRIAEFIRTFKPHNILETCVLIDYLLKSGFFSINSSFQYYKYENELFYISELSGARVMTGKTVCRHNAVFASEVLQAIGYNTGVLVVRTENTVIDDKEKLFEDDKNTLLWNHAVVGIQNNGQKMIYDPSSGEFAGQDPNLVELSKYCAFLYSFVDRKYQIIKPNQEEYKIQAKCTYNMKEFMDLPFISLEQHELYCAMHNIRALIEQNVNKFQNFKVENTEVVEKIAKLEKKIIPYSDGEITEWKLK